MKRRIASLAVVAGLVLIAGNALSYEYTVDRITNNSLNDSLVNINNRGELVWLENTGNLLYPNQANALLYSNGVTSVIGQDAACGPKINDRGSVVWETWNAETPGCNVQLYRDGMVSQISDYSGMRENYGIARNVQIGDNDTVCWKRDRDQSGDDVVYYRDGVTTAIDPHQYPGEHGSIAQSAMSDDGSKVVWSGWEQSRSHDDDLYHNKGVYLYSDTADPKTIYSQVSGGSLDVNNKGQAVWDEVYVVADPNTGENKYYDRVMYYDGYNAAKQIGGGEGYNQAAPQISNKGEVVWRGFNGQIYKFDGKAVTAVTSYETFHRWYDYRNPQINDDGDIVWYGNDGHKNQIFIYDECGFRQLTYTDFDNWNPMINDNGDIVWYGGYEGNNDIYAAWYGDSTNGGGSDQPVPEPGTWAMMGMGVLSLLGFEIRRRKFMK